MSSSYEIVCKSCGYRDVFRYGLGFLYNWEMLFNFHKNNEMLKRLVETNANYETIKKLLVNQHATISPDFGHDIYHCRHCNTFHEGFYIHLDFGDESFEPMYECKKCGLELDRVKVEESDICIRWHLDILHEKYPCPKCGKFTLKREFNI